MQAAKAACGQRVALSAPVSRSAIAASAVDIERRTASSVDCSLASTSRPSPSTPAAGRQPQARSKEAQLSRRGVLQTAGMACMVPWLQASGLQASAEPADLLSWIYIPPPEPVRFPRKPLDQVFAVMLMRSAYEAVDDLDFMPMDQFQRQFWLLRQSEQEGYNLAYSPLKPRLGDLTDPLYFDFISFSQYATIAREIPRGRQVFQEFCEDCPDQKKLVQRNPLNADNALLPAKFDALVADKIYDGMLNGFRGQQFGAPQPLVGGLGGAGAPSPVAVSQVVQGVQALLDIMVDRGYALKASVSEVQGEAEGRAGASGPQFRVVVQGPANLWGLGALRARRVPLSNSYEALAINGYLRASGIKAAYDVSLSDTGVVQLWTLQA